MLQNTDAIRHYQQLTDALVASWERGYRFDYLRMYVDGYLSALRNTKAMEPFQIHRLEEEVIRYLRDPSNFELAQPQVEYDFDYR